MTPALDACRSALAGALSALGLHDECEAVRAATTPEALREAARDAVPAADPFQRGRPANASDAAWSAWHNAAHAASGTQHAALAEIEDLPRRGLFVDVVEAATCSMLSSLRVGGAT